MFSGIIEAIGVIDGCDSRGSDVRVRVASGALDLADVAIGDSIAVAGVCVTAVDLQRHAFSADLSGETLKRTTLGDAPSGARVNLEKALLAGARIGGHLVSGHVDGVGRVVSRCPDGRSWRLGFEVEAGLARFIAAKGSIAVDGVSLTVNQVAGAQFEVNLIPHTLAATTLGDLAAEDRVNVEVDLMARYAARWLDTGAPPLVGQDTR